MQATSYPTTYKLHTDAGVFFDQMSIYDWIEQYVPGGHASRMGRLLDAAYNDEYGAETKDQAALNLMYLLGYQASPGNFLDLREVGRALPHRRRQRAAAAGDRRLSRPAERQARLGDAVDRGERRRHGVDAFSTPGKTQTVTADHVILSLPFAVLRTLDYSGATSTR